MQIKKLLTQQYDINLINDKQKQSYETANSQLQSNECFTSSKVTIKLSKSRLIWTRSNCQNQLNRSYKNIKLNTMASLSMPATDDNCIIT